eukprot:CAMPEP_0118912388 /NCGR_PEP_ID=MMETSP1166-20130328/13661_1 /TAXON_ID=1104430 /ORGANISM="Chrysoreinhardia sp, Strain CCMP3193" /LENGTH=1193 /DNA_ID=CAMNT_0006851907 /DNA_START=92 /DNA_END=3670 /DNA_ORIENTATION=+
MSSSTSYAVKRRFAGPELSPAALAERWQHCKKESPYVEGKHRLLPHMLRVITANIESFDYFVTTEIKKVVGAAPNKVIRSEVDPNWFLEYKDVYVGSPTIDEDSFTQSKATPFECRVRDETYSAPIYVDVEYRVGGATTAQKKVLLGKIPIMLRSSKCVLSGQSAAAVSKKNECEYDPGGYFIVKGVEKVILMQEQLSKNRVIVESDAKGHVAATITSSTHERKSRCSIVVKPYAHGKRVYLRHNTLGEDIPVVIVLKAMGLVSDQEIAELVAGGGGASNSSSSKKKKKSDLGGAKAQTPPRKKEKKKNSNSEEEEEEKKSSGTSSSSSSSNPVVDLFVMSLEEPVAARVRTQTQALLYVGNAIRAKQKAQELSQGAAASFHAARRPARADDEAREVLANVVLSHVPVKDYDFTAKRAYIGYVTRRVLAAELNRDLLDDKDYYGNKRLELAGQLLSLLFEDLFKRFNADLKRSAELVLQKQNRVNAFDVVKSTHWRTDTVTHGFSHAISTGNWVLKRFKMDRAGVTQVLSRLSYVSAVGMTTRVNSQFEKTRKTSGPRALQPSQWGMLCVAPGTPVLLADGTTLRPLDALEHLVGSKRGAPRIRCVDVHTRKAHASAVTDFQRVDVRRYGRDLLRVTTDAGRSIVVSEDHLFAVAPSTDDEERTYDAAAKEHFLAAGDLTVGLSRVLVMPTPLPEDAPTTSSEEDLGESLLLDRASFLAQASLDRRTEEVSDADLDDASSELEAAGLLPLRRDDSRLEALARLLGWASLAGHCGEREAHFDVCRGGDHADLLETLLNLTPRREDDVVVVVYGSKTTTKIVLSGSLVRLLRVLLAGGKPTTTTVATKKRGENPLLGGGDGVPAFVSSCRRPVKAAFLSGLFGAAGTAPLFRNGRLIPPTVDAPPFVGDLSILLSDLGIDAEQIPSKRKRNDDNDDSGFRLAVEGSDRNVLRFGALVGFAWHTEKQNTLRVVSEYLRSRATFDDVRRSLPPPGRRRRPSSDGVFSSSFQAFEEWRSEVSADCATGTLYDGVARVEEVSPSECPEVCDLTTASEAHTFVANGFVTHNCPADTPEGETCGLVKNLALLAHVTTDAEVDVVLRACFDLGVEQLGHLGGRSLSSSSRTDESRGVSCYLVFLNGLVIGATSRPRKLANALRRTRRSGGIGRFVSVYANDVHRSIFVACDGGRVCRPLVVA